MLTIDSATVMTTSATTSRVLLIGLGGAGMNVLDRAALDGLNKSQIVALNTDIQSLTASVAGKKVQLGRTVTRGLGTGGDPELGFESAQEAQGDLEAMLEGATVVFICVGLGGGTGSGAAPLLAKMAKAAGAVVFVFATLPFTFEGKRRNSQAAESLASLEGLADAVVCFENDRMAETVSGKAGIHEAFAAADMVVSQSIRSIIDFLQNPGFVKVGISDLLAALRNHESRCVFGFGEGEGSSAAHDALVRALKSPLMDRGKMLESARNVLVHVAGGQDMTLAQLQMLMTELGRHINDQTQILMGTSVQKDMAQRIRVTIISSFGSRATGGVENAPSLECATEPELSPVSPPIFDDLVEGESASEPVEVPVAQVSEVVEIASEPAEPETEELIPVEPEPVAAEVKQEDFEFEPVKTGRFEKSEPTIEDGEDLDIPAFLRNKGL